MPSMISALGLDKLSGIERRALVDELLDSIHAERTAAALTQSQSEELARRLAEDDANPEDAIPWEQVKAEARARHGR